MAFNSLSGTVVVHPGSHLDASGSAITATSLYTSGSKGAVHEKAGVKTFTCTEIEHWISCSGSFVEGSGSSLTLVSADAGNTNVILRDDAGDNYNISPSGSVLEGAAGATRYHPAYLQLSGNADNSFVDHSYSGSYYSASCGTRTITACSDIFTTTDGESTVSVSGSFTTGSEGTTEAEGGVVIHSSTDTESTTSSSGSFTTGSEGTTTTVGGVTYHISTDYVSTLSTSGSLTTGSSGTTSATAGLSTYTSTDTESTTSTSGSFTTGSVGTTTTVGGLTIHVSTDTTSTLSTSGSFTTGSDGTTTTAGGSSTYTSTDTEYTLSTSGSFTTGSSGTTEAVGGITLSLSTDYTHWTSTSGSFLTGTAGTTTWSPAFAEYTAPDYTHWTSASGSYLTGAAGYIRVFPEVAVYASTDYTHWTSTSGSHVEGSAGITTISPGSVSSSMFYGDGSALYGIDATRLDITAGTDGMILSLGLNYFTASTNPIKVYVPSASYGDCLYIKTGPGVSATNYVMITSSNAYMLNTFDGATTQKIESPYGSVALVYVKDHDWRIL